MKKFLIILLCFIIGITMNQINVNGETIIYDGKEHSYNNISIGIRINGVKVENGDMYPVVINDRTLVSVREIMESPSVGATVDWITESKTVLITKDDKVITLKVGESKGYVNGQEIILDSKAMLIKDKSIDVYKMMVPIRFVSESLGFFVEWDKANKEVLLTSEQSSADALARGESDITKLIKASNQTSIPTPLRNNSFSYKAKNINAFIKLEDGSNKASYDTTKINDITTNDKESKFYITALNQVSTVDYSITDDKLILDIHGLVMGDFPTTIRMDKGVYVSAVRTSQYDYSPYIARIVFDLYDKSIPRGVVVSEDRKTIEVSFNETGLDQIDISQDNTGDMIKIKGDYSDYNCFRLNYPSRLVFDLNYTINLLDNQYFTKLEGQLIESVRLNMPDTSTTRLIVETKDHSDFELSYNPDSDITTISFKPLIYSGVSMNYEKYPTLVISKTSSLKTYNIDLISQEATHLGFDSTISFNQVINEISANQSFFVGDIHTNRINITTNNQKTQITFANKHILEYIITEDESNIYIQGIRPKELYNTMVLLDAGHGGYQPGAVYNGLLEKDINLKLMHYIRRHTEQRQEIKYFYTRTDDSALSLPDRVTIANDLEVDLFVSMHNNAIDIGKNPLLTEVRGLEVITTIGTQTSQKERLFAEDFFTNMTSMLPELILRDIKDYNKLYLLKYSDMPAVIIEYGYLTNPEDVENLKKEWILEEAARITELTIFKYFNP